MGNSKEKVDLMMMMVIMTMILMMILMTIMMSIMLMIMMYENDLGYYCGSISFVYTEIGANQFRSGVVYYFGPLT